MTVPFYVPPEQLVKDRADFARKGVARGRPIVVATMDAGILFVGENSSPSLRKIGEVYDRIAFAGVGRFNEFETLRVAGVRYADLKGYSYARPDVTAKGLANAYSQTLGQIFAHEIKPYEVDIIVAEVGSVLADDKLFRIGFDGTLRDAHGLAVLGGGEDEITEAMTGTVTPDMAVQDALRVMCDAIEQATDRPIPDDAWETGLLERNGRRRKFRRLSIEDVAASRS
ncbi:MAG: proteasome subunit alpha [Acidimicrobiia bacterium]|nr:MAG: proteasome subunit alpha [Acidimicrobiia bacterium]